MQFIVYYICIQNGIRVKTNVLGIHSVTLIFEYLEVFGCNESTTVILVFLVMNKSE